MPKVSVIIPVYGVEKYIERCANSLFAQTLDDIEFIFIDDCTPDRSIEILKKCINDKRQIIEKNKWVVRVEQMPQNSGQAAVRQHGIKMATGDYFIQCDSDDWVAEEMYEIMYKEAIKNKVDVVICTDYYTDGTHHRLNTNDMYNDDKYGHMKYMLLGKASSSLCTKLIKRSIFIDNQILYPVANHYEDGTLSLQSIYYANRHVFINKPYYYYFTNMKSATKKPGADMCIRRFKGAQENIRICETFLKEHNLDKMFRSTIDAVKFRSRLYLLRSIDNEEVKTLFKNGYPGINRRAMFSTIIPLKMKLRYIYNYCKVLFVK